MKAGPSLDIQVDGATVRVAAGTTVLAACDVAGRYVPRLCHYPGLSASVDAVADKPGGQTTECGHGSCGLCAVRLGDGATVLACITIVVEGMSITTDDEGLRAARTERLADILARHPHICLSCPDRDGCARDECTYGNPPEARCCDRLGDCEFGMLVRWLDDPPTIPRKAVAVARDAFVEGRIRREPGLCIGCGRCIRVCEGSRDGGEVLEIASTGVAIPARGTLRASGCTFCGRCVVVCPTGALTAPGDAGEEWLTRCRERSGLPAPVLPPEERSRFTADAVQALPDAAGVFRLFDAVGDVVRISGVADLRRGLAEALADPACGEAVSFGVELEELYTQRESELLARHAQRKGHLPPWNDLGDDLFDDD